MRKSGNRFNISSVNGANRRWKLASKMRPSFFSVMTFPRESWSLQSARGILSSLVCFTEGTSTRANAASEIHVIMSRNLCQHCLQLEHWDFKKQKTCSTRFELEFFIFSLFLKYYWCRLRCVLKLSWKSICGVFRLWIKKIPKNSWKLLMFAEVTILRSWKRISESFHCKIFQLKLRF